jgi:hypothetical protein
MPLSDTPPTPIERADHWLAIAEGEYEGRQFERSAAAAHLAAAWAQRAELAIATRDDADFVELYGQLTATTGRLTVDAFGIDGPTGAQLRAAEAGEGR